MPDDNDAPELDQANPERLYEDLKRQAMLTIFGATFAVYAPAELSDQEIWRSMLEYASRHEIALGARYSVVSQGDADELN